MSDILVERRHLPVVAEKRSAIAEQTRDTRALEAALRKTVRGEVRFDRGSRALYAADASNYRQVPLGLVIPHDADDVIATMKACREHGVPVLPRGGGTGLAGQTTNVAVVLDNSKRFDRILEVNAEARWARVQPGVVLDALREKAKEHDLTFGPDPATHEYCTLGGMIGNDSCGVHALMAGKTVENVHELDVLLYDGTRLTVGETSDEEYRRIVAEGGRKAEIYRRLRALRDRYADAIRARFADIPRRVSGYNLDQLLPENGFHVARALVGSEATCAYVLEAKVRLVPARRHRVLVVVGFRDVYEAADAVPEVLEHGPIGLEGIDDQLIQFMKLKHLHEPNLRFLPEGKGFLLVELGSDEDPDEPARKARAFCEQVTRRSGVTARVFTDTDEQQQVWKIRESGLGATARVPGHRDAWPGWEDSAVAPEDVGRYLRDLRALFDEHGYDASLYGHFGQGCVHCRIDFDLITAPGIEKYRRFVHDAAHLVARYGGSLSGEHGDGHARGALLPIQFGDEIVEAFHEFKTIWDPDRRMNPRQAAAWAPPVTADLRLGTSYAPADPPTHFSFQADDGSFARATTRCVGVGKCRRDGGGTMCPSYMVTHEEMHTTRGRAHLLFEMMRGEVVGGDGWRDEHVKESLDLCLACKGCKADCPVSVDMATYKAEFLSHYWEGRVRPVSAYAMGFIDVWARLAQPVPWLANWIAGNGAVGRMARSLAGLAPDRAPPPFAKQTFTSWWRKTRRGVSSGHGSPRVILWCDTFNEHFHPDVGIAAAESLEKLGYEVVVPRERFCCGRPLYDFGFLDRAKRMAGAIVDSLRDEIRAGTPVVGLEPSCVAVLRDELVDLFPHDHDARRLQRQTFLLSELLQEHPPPARTLPRLERPVLLHGHCHQKAVLDFEKTKETMRQLGVELDVLESGCCGVAGAFGYEKHHYDVSMAAGERVLLPAVRSADARTLIVTDGFSCRSQVSHATERRALHFAHLLRMALEHGPAGPDGDRPERFALGGE